MVFYCSNSYLQVSKLRNISIKMNLGTYPPLYFVIYIYMCIYVRISIYIYVCVSSKLHISHNLTCLKECRSPGPKGGSTAQSEDPTPGDAETRRAGRRGPTGPTWDHRWS